MFVYHKLGFASSAKCELIKSVFVIYFDWNFSAVTFEVVCVYSLTSLNFVGISCSYNGDFE